MKKCIEYGLITLMFVLSFVYTNKVANIVKAKDPIMKQIRTMEVTNIKSVDAKIDGNVIEQGVIGCSVDVTKSYEAMKMVNEYRDTLLKYKDVIPSKSLRNIYNYYIVGGNNVNRNISIVVYISNSVSELSKYNIKLNVFLDASMLDNGSIDMPKTAKVYNGGNSRNYDDITIEWVNDVITDSYNKPTYCINLNQNKDNLDICSKNRMHTIKAVINPSLILTKNNVYDIKSKIDNGSIIYVDENNISLIKNIINFANKKGFNIVYLDELLDERTCK